MSPKDCHTTKNKNITFFGEHLVSNFPEDQICKTFSPNGVILCCRMSSSKTQACPFTVFYHWIGLFHTSNSTKTIYGHLWSNKTGIHVFTICHWKKKKAPSRLCPSHGRAQAAPRWPKKTQPSIHGYPPSMSHPNSLTSEVVCWFSAPHSFASDQTHLLSPLLVFSNGPIPDREKKLEKMISKGSWYTIRSLSCLFFSYVFPLEKRICPAFFADPLTS